MGQTQDYNIYKPPGVIFKLPTYDNLNECAITYLVHMFLTKEDNLYI